LRQIKCGNATTAQSGDGSTRETVMRSMLFAATALAALAAATPAAAKQGDWLVRLRAIVVAPNESSGPVLPSFPSATVGVGNAVMPELDFTYMATDHIGIELILATTRHTISGQGSLEPVGPLASTWVLPPTLTAQYHFTPEAKVRPYVGVGLNWSIFYSESASDELENAVGATDVGLSNSVGVAFQAGIDIDLSPKVFLNFDIKYITMGTNATLTTGALVNTVDVDVNPLVFGVGLGTRF
jgi:outer membrane protein